MPNKFEAYPGTWSWYVALAPRNLTELPDPDKTRYTGSTVEGGSSSGFAASSTSSSSSSCTCGSSSQLAVASLTVATGAAHAADSQRR